MACRRRRRPPPTCLHTDCTRVARYAAYFSTPLRPTHCSHHKGRAWYSQCHVTCAHVCSASGVRCWHRATFAECTDVPESAFRGRLTQRQVPRPVWCTQHAPPTAKDVRTRRCLYCSRAAFFYDPCNPQHTRGRVVCAEHAARPRRSTTRPSHCSVCGSDVTPVVGGSHASRICARCRVRGDVPVAGVRVSQAVEDAVAVHVFAWVRRLRALLPRSRRLTCTANTPVPGLLLRPDVLVRSPTWAVVVEVDEHQHSAYKPAAEARRMLDIARVLRRPVAFLRFNPHGATRDATTFQASVDEVLLWLTWFVLRPQPPQRCCGASQPQVQCIFFNYASRS